MKISSKLIRFAAIFAVAVAAPTVAQGDVVVFSEDFESATASVGSLVASSFTVTPITDPLDATNTVGEAVIAAGTGFANLNTNSAVPEPLPANTLSVDASVDLIVPTGGAGTAGDFAFLQLNFLDAAGVNVGQFNSAFPSVDVGAATLDTVQTLSVSQPLPAGAVSFTSLLIAGDFANDSTAGTVFLVDNFLVDATVAVIPEPTSLALFGLAGVIGLARRRR